MKQITRPLIAIAFATFALAATAPAAEPKAKIETKIVVNSEVAKKNFKGQSALVLYPENEYGAAFDSSGAADMITEALEKKGYLIVQDEKDANVFIKVDVAQPPPFEVEANISGRPQVDYSNAASTRNYASILAGGRYEKLGNPHRLQATNEVEVILGPNGEVIDLAEEKPREPTLKEGDKATVSIKIFPLYYQIEAWQFDEDTPDAPPSSVWRVHCAYENVLDEAVAPQLQDITEAAVKYIGKPLKSPKTIKRK